MFEFPCVILAGGKSSRMGTDKSLLPFGGYESLTQYQLQKCKPLFKTLFVSSKRDKFAFDADFILDDMSIFSPMVALANVLSHFTNTHVFILSVDTPFVGKKEIKRMQQFIDKYHIIIPKTASNVHPLCGFYHSSLAKSCKELVKKDIHKIQVLCESESVKYVEFEDEKPFSNLNYMSEYEKVCL